MDRALVIGGNSGIGRATAIAITETDPALKVYTPPVKELDVRLPDGIKDYLQANGPFKHIVYSAGVNVLNWVSNPNIDVAMEETFTINCTGFVSLISHHTGLFPGEPFSAVTVSSDAGRIPMRGSVAYCASKAALNMAVKVMARELAPVHRINAVAPGMVDGTPMTEYIDQTIPEFRGWTPHAAREYETHSTPTRRRATVTEVAWTIAWVLFGPAQMTGAIIDVTGGR